LNEKDEVLEAGVEMRFFAKRSYLWEMGVVYMAVHSKQSLEDLSDNILETFGERNAFIRLLASLSI